MPSNLITLLRISHQKKVQDLATSLKISVNKYLDIESGKIKVSPAQALILSEIYFLEPSVFMSDDKPMININAGSNNRMVINLYAHNYYETDANKPVNDNDEK